MIAVDRGCEHTEFRASVTVKRLTAVEGGPATGYEADVAITCQTCGTQFSFLGDLPAGSFARIPHVNADSTVLHAPLIPGPQPLRGNLTYEFEPPKFR